MPGAVPKWPAWLHIVGAPALKEMKDATGSNNHCCWSLRRLHSFPLSCECLRWAFDEVAAVQQPALQQPILVLCNSFSLHGDHSSAAGAFARHLICIRCRPSCRVFPAGPQYRDVQLNLTCLFRTLLRGQALSTLLQLACHYNVICSRSLHTGRQVPGAPPAKVSH